MAAFGVLLLCLGAKVPIVDWVMHTQVETPGFAFIILSVSIAVAGSRQPSLVNWPHSQNSSHLVWVGAHKATLNQSAWCRSAHHLTEGSLADLITTLMIGLSLVLPAYLYLLWVFKRPGLNPELIQAFEQFDTNPIKDLFLGFPRDNQGY